jgi:hypothetical protein
MAGMATESGPAGPRGVVVVHCSALSSSRVSEAQKVDICILAYICRYSLYVNM